jgi:sugar lactone lactonase YvrE
MDVAVAPDGSVWIADSGNHRMLRVDPLGGVTLELGQRDLLATPAAIRIRENGVGLIADWGNDRLLQFDVFGRQIRVIGHSFHRPSGVDVNYRDEVFVVEQSKHRVRAFSAGADEPWTVAGNGAPGYTGDGGDPLTANLRFAPSAQGVPSGSVLVGPHGALYIADSRNHCVRRVVCGEEPVIETIAGTGSPGFDGDGAEPARALLRNPTHLAWGPDWRLYISDTGNNRVRAVDLRANTIETVVGGEVGIRLTGPRGVTFDDDGAMYIADTGNDRIVRVSAP